VIFDPPAIHFSEALGRRFAYQTDGNLCAMHALNNIARSFVVTPSTFYQTIYDVADPHLPGEDDARWFRARVNSGGNEGDLAIAALRRGVVLARVVVRNIFDIESLLTPTTAYPLHTPLEMIAQQNGGIVVLAPRGGHYVAILPSTENGWVLLNDRSPVGREQELHNASFGALLRIYYLRKLAVMALDHGDIEATARRLRTTSTHDLSTELRLLVPLHYVPELNASSQSVDRLAHYWARYVVCNTTATTDNVNPPEGDLVLALNYASARINESSADCAQDQRNLFTQLLAKTYIELELNEIADQLAEELLRRQPSRATVERLVTDARRVLVSQRALGTLLDVASSCAPLTNREWLRFAALHIVCANKTVAEAPRDLLFLLMNCLFTDHRPSGDVEGRYPSIVKIWTQLHAELSGKSASTKLPQPRGSLPHERAIKLILFTLPPTDNWNFFQFNILRRVSFDRSLWLLSAFVDAFPGHGVDRETLAQLQPVRRIERILTEDPASDAHRYVERLREHFFLSTVQETSDVDASVRARVTSQRVLFAVEPEFLVWFDVIAAPRRLVVGDPPGIPFIPWEQSAQLDAASKGKPQLLLRLYTTISQLFGTFYDRRNPRVNPGAPELRDSLTTRYEVATSSLAPSAEPIIAFEDE